MDGEGFPPSLLPLSVVLPKHPFITCSGNPSDFVRISHHQITLTSLSLGTAFLYTQILWVRGSSRTGVEKAELSFRDPSGKVSWDYKLNPAWLVAQGSSW